MRPGQAMAGMVGRNPGAGLLGDAPPGFNNGNVMNLNGFLGNQVNGGHGNQIDLNNGIQGHNGMGNNTIASLQNQLCGGSSRLQVHQEKTTYNHNQHPPPNTEAKPLLQVQPTESLLSMNGLNPVSHVRNTYQGTRNCNPNPGTSSMQLLMNSLTQLQRGRVPYASQPGNHETLGGGLLPTPQIQPVLQVPSTNQHNNHCYLGNQQQQQREQSNPREHSNAHETGNRRRRYDSQGSHGSSVGSHTGSLEGSRHNGINKIHYEDRRGSEESQGLEYELNQFHATPERHVSDERHVNVNAERQSCERHIQYDPANPTEDEETSRNQEMTFGFKRSRSPHGAAHDDQDIHQSKKCQQLGGMGFMNSNEFICRACNTTSHSIQEFDNHMSSVVHTQRMSDIYTLHLTKLQHKPTSDNREFCDICDRYYHGNFSVHKKTDEHKRKDRLTRKGCLLCKTGSFPRYPEYVAHIDSISHKQKKQQLAKDLAARSGENEVKPPSPPSPECPDPMQTDTQTEPADITQSPKLDVKLAYDSSLTVGGEYIVAVSGYFCRLCEVFYTQEDQARVTHCRTPKHFQHYKNVVEDPSSMSVMDLDNLPPLIPMGLSNHAEQDRSKVSPPKVVVPNIEPDESKDVDQEKVVEVVKPRRSVVEKLTGGSKCARGAGKVPIRSTVASRLAASAKLAARVQKPSIAARFAASGQQKKLEARKLTIGVGRVVPGKVTNGRTMSKKLAQAIAGGQPTKARMRGVFDGTLSQNGVGLRTKSLPGRLDESPIVTDDGENDDVFTKTNGDLPNDDLSDKDNLDSPVADPENNNISMSKLEMHESQRRCFDMNLKQVRKLSENSLCSNGLKVNGKVTKNSNGDESQLSRRRASLRKK